MVDYKLDGTVREKDCDKNSPISKLTTCEPEDAIYSVAKVIEKIENGDKFWSYVYKDGKIIEETKIEVEPIHDREKGDYVRTRRDGVDENNLLELPIWHIVTNSEGKKVYRKC